MEFCNLQQGEMTVTEYDRKFRMLLRYAYDLVDTDAKKAKRFLSGLRQEIQTALAGVGELVYKVTLQRALTIERTLPPKIVPSAPNRQNSPPRQDFKRKFDSDSYQSSNHSRHNYSANNKVPYQAGSQTQNKCSRCGRTHPNQDCPTRNAVCNNCGKTGHYARM
jgi:hypothetical protein